MKKIVVAIPHSHTFFWTGTCLAHLAKYAPRVPNHEVEIVVVDNSPWSPAILGVTETSLGHGVTVRQNTKGNKFHASALDYVVENFEFDYLMAFETDVLALRPGWLDYFMQLLQPTDFAVGHWHHEQFINPSCTLYRGDVVRKMAEWSKNFHHQYELRWGENFEKTAPLDHRLQPGDEERLREWICGPFADKRGWPEGTRLKEPPSGQAKGPGWYEPGQMLHAWAVNEGYTYTVCPTTTTFKQAGMPVQTFYGTDREPGRVMEVHEMGGYAETVHLWGGTRALDIIKHAVECEFVKSNTPFWLEREARFWRDSVPVEVREKTLELIRLHGWHYRGAGTPEVTQRDRDAAAFVRECYAKGGVTW